MPAFHQIGHNSENLLFEEGLTRFGGAILSPLNYGPAEIAGQLASLKGRESFETIFDPHLYRPQSERMCLPEWEYYPKDVDTADFTAEKWWASVVENVAKTAAGLGTTAVASPAVVPKAFPDDFFCSSSPMAIASKRPLHGTADQTDFLYQGE